MCESPVDLTGIKTAVGDNTVLVETLVEHLLLEYPKSIERLRELIASGDAKEVVSHAHKFKGMIANFGAESAKDMALEIEKMGKSRQFDSALETLEKLETEMGLIKEFFSASDWQMNL